MVCCALDSSGLLPSNCIILLASHTTIILISTLFQTTYFIGDVLRTYILLFSEFDGYMEDPPIKIQCGVNRDPGAYRGVSLHFGRH